VLIVGQSYKHQFVANNKFTIYTIRSAMLHSVHSHTQCLLHSLQQLSLSFNTQITLNQVGNNNTWHQTGQWQM